MNNISTPYKSIEKVPENHSHSLVFEGIFPNNVTDQEITREIGRFLEKLGFFMYSEGEKCNIMLEEKPSHGLSIREHTTHKVSVIFPENNNAQKLDYSMYILLKQFSSGESTQMRFISGGNNAEKWMQNDAITIGKCGERPEDSLCHIVKEHCQGEAYIKNIWTKSRELMQFLEELKHTSSDNQLLQIKSNTKLTAHLYYINRPLYHKLFSTLEKAVENNDSNNFSDICNDINLFCTQSYIGELIQFIELQTQSLIQETKKLLEQYTSIFPGSNTSPQDDIACAETDIVERVSAIVSSNEKQETDNQREYIGVFRNFHNSLKVLTEHKVGLLESYTLINSENIINLDTIAEKSSSLFTEVFKILSNKQIIAKFYKTTGFIGQKIAGIREGSEGRANIVEKEELRENMEFVNFFVGIFSDNKKSQESDDGGDYCFTYIQQQIDYLSLKNKLFKNIRITEHLGKENAISSIELSLGDNRHLITHAVYENLLIIIKIQRGELAEGELQFEGNKFILAGKVCPNLVTDYTYTDTDNNTAPENEFVFDIPDLKQSSILTSGANHGIRPHIKNPNGDIYLIDSNCQVEHIRGDPEKLIVNKMSFCAEKGSENPLECNFITRYSNRNLGDPAGYTSYAYTTDHSGTFFIPTVIYDSYQNIYKSTEYPDMKHNKPFQLKRGGDPITFSYTKNNINHSQPDGAEHSKSQIFITREGIFEHTIYSGVNKVKNTADALELPKDKLYFTTITKENIDSLDDALAEANGIVLKMANGDYLQAVKNTCQICTSANNKVTIEKLVISDITIQVNQDSGSYIQIQHFKSSANTENHIHNIDSIAFV